MQPKLRPSRKLRELVAEFHSPRLAALEWGIQPGSLLRFLRGYGSLSAASISRLIEQTGYGYDALFIHSR